MFEAYEMQANESLSNSLDIQYPVYRTCRGEIFKLVSKTMVISLRNDDQVKGIGVSDCINTDTFMRIYRYEESDAETYYELHKILSSLINTYQ